MKAEAQHEERAYSLSGRARITPSVRHPLDDLLRDLAVFGERAVGLEHAHDQLEGIAMNTYDTLDFLRPMGSVPEADFAGRMPILLGSCDLLGGD
ncbi:MAG: hypothetical protein ABS35_28200 [Kaistia sp. SCN 65-12]|nr:MAG: hypothetical protein ABS35_28200 [Kaistia sp. SCN 65-12]